MRKKSLFSKVIAITAVTAMFATTTAFAASYSTTTLYVKGNSSNVEVKTTVTDLSAGDEVTYLAGDSTDPVYINQYTATEGTNVFSYQTTAAKVSSAPTIKMAKADSTFANGEAVTAAENEGTIPEAAKFKFSVSIDGVAKDAVEFIPSELTTDTKISVPITLETGKEIDEVKIGDNAATYIVSDGNVIIDNTVVVTVNDNDNTFSPNNAAIVITTKDKKVTPKAAPVFLKGFKAPKYSHDFGGDKPVTGQMFAIYATVEGCKDEDEFGIAVSYDAAFEKDADSSKYSLYPSAATMGDETTFAIAIIDEDSATTKVYYRTYYKNGDTVVLGDKLGTVSFE